jgi:hypothetical protein
MDRKDDLFLKLAVESVWAHFLEEIGVDPKEEIERCRRLDRTAMIQHIQKIAIKLLNKRKLKYNGDESREHFIDPLRRMTMN